MILFSGDAYVDHPSFGCAVIGRIIESEGLKVAIVPQPNWKDERDFVKLGKPRLFFGVTGGCMDPMVNHYTASKRRRSTAQNADIVAVENQAREEQLPEQLGVISAVVARRTTTTLYASKDQKQTS